MQRKQLIFSIVILIVCVSTPAAAHKVSVFAWVEGETVHTESKFSGGKKVKDGKIQVFNHRNQLVLDGITDGQGYFAFPVDKKAQTLKVVLTAGMGHSNHWLVTAQELGYDKTDQPAQTTERPQPPNEKNLTDCDAIGKIVESAVEKKLAPIKAQLAEQAWGMRDIVAGIGYILGLMGLASYLHHRKTQSNKV